jgi:cAMP-specific phosphodiesterase
MLPIVKDKKVRQMEDKLLRLKKTTVEDFARQQARVSDRPSPLSHTPPPPRRVSPTLRTAPSRHQQAHLDTTTSVYQQGTSIHHRGASIKFLEREEASFDIEELKRVRMTTLLRVLHEQLAERNSHGAIVTREERHWLREVHAEGIALHALPGAARPESCTDSCTGMESLGIPVDASTQIRAVDMVSWQRDENSADDDDDPAPRTPLPLHRYASQRLRAASIAPNATHRGSLSVQMSMMSSAAVMMDLLQAQNSSSVFEAATSHKGVEALMTWVREDAVDSRSSMRQALLDFAIRCTAAPVSQRREVLTSMANQVRLFSQATEAYLWYAVDDCFVRNDEEKAVNFLAPPADEGDALLIRCVTEKSTQVATTRVVLPIRIRGAVIGVLDVIGGKLPKGKSKEEFVAELSIQAEFAELYLRTQLMYLELSRAQDSASVLFAVAAQLAKENIADTAAYNSEEALIAAEHRLVLSVISSAQDLTDSERCSVFLVRGSHLEAHVGAGMVVTVGIDQGIAGHVATTGETVRLKDAYDDPRFNCEVDKHTGFRTTSLLAMPVYHDGEVIAVAQLINKLPLKETKTTRFFTDRDEELFASFASFVGISLHNLRANVRLAAERRKTDALFTVARELAHADITNIEAVSEIVLESARTIVRADRASLFLVDREHAELYTVSGANIRVPLGSGIVGAVAATGLADRIHDAYGDTRFNRDVDVQLGYKTRSLITVPVKIGGGDVVAVAQLVNRLGGADKDASGIGTFSDDDVRLLEAFAAFAGMSLHNARLVEFAVKAANEATAMLSPKVATRRGSSFDQRHRTLVDKVTTWWYHLYEDDETAPMGTSNHSTHDVDELGVKTAKFDVVKLMGRARPTPTARDTASRIVASIIEHYARPFDVPKKVITQFVVACRERYRSVPYHNFFHAVDTVQTIFVFLKLGGMESRLTPLECFTLIVATLCHDLDHMGLNNSFYMKTESPLGILSATTGSQSVLEVHHCNEAIEILSHANTDVFGPETGVSAEERKHAVTVLIKCILATDMQRHKDILDQFKALTMLSRDEKPLYDRGDEAHRLILLQMLIKAADISNVTKPFHISSAWAERVTEEFYNQGDREKESGIDDVPAMFDRDAGLKLADGQIGFIDFVAKPFFATLASFDSGMQPWLDQLQQNVQTWRERKTS